MSRRRSFLRRQLRQTLREFLARNLWPLALMAGVYAAMVAVGQLGGGDGYWLGFVHGAVLLTFTGMVGIMFLLHTGAISQVAGIVGEDRTTEEVAKAVNKGWVWGAVHNVELADGDIDTIAVTPAGVVAIETKWMMRQLDRRWLHRDVAQAARGASKTRAVLRSKGIGEVHDVMPLLVIWGKAARDVAEGGELHDGVRVIDGNEIAPCLRSFGHGGLGQDHARQLLGALGRFAEDRAVVRPVQQPPTAGHPRPTTPQRRPAGPPPSR